MYTVYKEQAIFKHEETLRLDLCFEIGPFAE